MRRIEFDVKDDAAFNALMKECEYGTLGLYDNEPYCAPVNFVWHNGGICFHGALEGRKADIFKQNTKCAFSVVKPYALIASFLRSSNACSATQLFASAHIIGYVEIICDAALKIDILTAMMQKLQPSGGYEPLDSRAYEKMLAMTGIYKLTPISYSLKIKAMQNLSNTQREELIVKLKEQGGELNIATARLIERCAPN